MPLDIITPADRRWWRALGIPDEHIFVNSYILPDGETVYAEFICQSQSGGEPYAGYVEFNGRLMASNCKCMDFNDETRPESEVPRIDGVRVCKHACKSMQVAGYQPHTQFIVSALRAAGVNV